VLISDEALRAAVKLTDAYVTDRMRPDKAIDAIDEACAHMQAVIQYSERTETLIQRRMSLLKELARIEREDEKRKPADRGGTSRESPSAFERFGAELEALFVGAPATTTPVNGTEAQPAPVPERARPSMLAPLEADLGRQLMEEGVVIRGHDIARVVGLMAGTDVEWRETDNT